MMPATHFPWLTTLTLLPALGSLLLLALPGRTRQHARAVALALSLATLALTLLLAHCFDNASPLLQFQEMHRWVPALGMEYRLGIDGIGLLMLLLSSVVVPIAILAATQIQDRAPLYFALVLLLQSCLFGTFTAMNFLHWFLYWELGLVPAFFLVKLWGLPQNAARRSKAAMQFLVYTMVGSITLLLAFIALFLATNSFNFAELAQLTRGGQLMPAVTTALGQHRMLPQQVGMLIFCGAFLGFAVKIPLVPFHTWLPDAYTEAPTSTTILLTGAMSKMGLYGFLRILLPIFAPQMRAALTPLLWLTVATIVLSAYSALAQTNLKRIFAYSSINHLGYCVLGLLAVVQFSGASLPLAAAKQSAMDGALLQIFNHALTAATLFWFVAMLEQRTDGLRGLNDFGGLRKVVPVFTGLMGIAIFSSLGLPGLNGFVGEFLIFQGSFPLVTLATCLSLLGLLVTAIFLLGIVQRVFSGPLNETWQSMPDLSTTERVALLPVIACMFCLGLYPQLLLRFVNQTVVLFVQHLP